MTRTAGRQLRFRVVSKTHETELFSLPTVFPAKSSVSLTVPLWTRQAGADLRDNLVKADAVDTPVGRDLARNSRCLRHPLVVKLLTPGHDHGVDRFKGSQAVDRQPVRLAMQHHMAKFILVSGDHNSGL